MGLMRSPDNEAGGPPDPPPADPEKTVVLVRRTKDGDARAREQLLERYYPRLMEWASGRLPPGARDQFDTFDIVQECLIRTLKQLDTFEFRHEGAFRAYLQEAIRNRIRNEVRRVARRPASVELTEAERDPTASPLEDVIASDILACYQKALTRLSEDERTAIRLRVELECDYEKIAAAMGKPSPDAARMAVTRALDSLAREMKRLS